MDVGTVSRFLATLTLASLALGALLLLLLAFPAGRRRVAREVGGMERGLLALATGVATAAMVGSLYLSEVVGFVPCVLCWYQRIAMYPLVPILGVAAARNDDRVGRYALPLSVTGLLVAAYHVTIQLRPSLEVVPCSGGAPCTGRYLAVFGFVSIPVMAAGAFLLVTALVTAVAVSRRTRSGEDAEDPASPGVAGG